MSSTGMGSGFPEYPPPLQPPKEEAKVSKEKPEELSKPDVKKTDDQFKSKLESLNNEKDRLMASHKRLKSPEVGYNPKSLTPYDLGSHAYNYLDAMNKLLLNPNGVSNIQEKIKTLDKGLEEIVNALKEYKGMDRRQVDLLKTMANELRDCANKFQNGKIDQQKLSQKLEEIGKQMKETDKNAMVEIAQQKIISSYRESEKPNNSFIGKIIKRFSW